MDNIINLIFLLKQQTRPRQLGTRQIQRLNRNQIQTTQFNGYLSNYLFSLQQTTKAEMPILRQTSKLSRLHYMRAETNFNLCIYIKQCKMNNRPFIHKHLNKYRAVQKLMNVPQQKLKEQGDIFNWNKNQQKLKKTGHFPKQIRTQE
ncbi:Hypothetical_protein [Hexamita inflata]|uniref:Hypothetical_protein n=1 Tax=Hexamita inflata TaxID=28002 RepID=A0AA86P3L3_9EUKA|nr:Hypothetical protein HINF_LOCUS17798 [Hexamita inflata]CAI9930156.1 Hypothetical protein HINF_LOCUS17801 [Hexamita inflata]CAI9935642.1 Hypothetical protein HINF_LOCUS23287 [Hexamita inflata]CAI9935645.1 Hypothetical protein HINF_LOCUS23290 [Hexamita inflata]CAI9940606.1 Hypothetical protein HINF_LOCUS28251 [Hexamita inflata]